jgi:ABC-type polysaccharide/polyol phosphate export systems, permease component
MAVFYIVFGIFLNRSTPNFVAFLLIGITIWQWFSSSVTNALNSIIAGKGLIMQVDIPKVFFPLETLLRDSFKNFFAVALLLIFLVFYPTPITIHWLALPALIAIQFTLNAGIAFICASLVPFIPDLRFVITTAIQLAFFGSGVFYSIEQIILPEHRGLIYLNPMAGLIRNYRLVLINQQWPDWNYLAGALAGSLLTLLIGLYLLKSFDSIYPRISQ